LCSPPHYFFFELLSYNLQQPWIIHLLIMYIFTQHFCSCQTLFCNQTCCCQQGHWILTSECPLHQTVVGLISHVDMCVMPIRSESNLNKTPQNKRSESARARSTLPWSVEFMRSEDEIKVKGISDVCE